MNRRRFGHWLTTFLGYSWVCGALLQTAAPKAWARLRKRLLPADTDFSTLPYEDPATLDARHLPITPVEQFGVSGTSDHRVDLERWRLQIEGLPNRPRSFDYRQLLALPVIERKVLLICPGTFAYVARWQGFSLWDLLHSCGLSATATHVDILGPPADDRKIERFSLQEIRQNHVFLATGVNGRTLPRPHGYPLRVVAEGHIGAEWVKYVYGVRVLRSSEAPTEPPAATPGAAFLP